MNDTDMRAQMLALPSMTDEFAHRLTEPGLTDGQRAIVAAELATAGRGRRHPNATTITQAQAARFCGTTIRNIQRASRILRDGEPEVIEAVRNGHLTLTPATAIVERPRHRQARLLADQLA